MGAAGFAVTLRFSVFYGITGIGLLAYGIVYTLLKRQRAAPGR